MTGPERKYIIRKQGCYYRPNERGYTTSAIQAGRYTRDELLGIDEDWTDYSALLADRRDPAALAALPEVQAMIAAAYEAAAKFLTDTVAEWSCGHDARHCDCWRDKEQWSLAAEAVEGLTPADATAALAARDAAMIARGRVKGLREAATLLREQGYGTAPTPPQPLRRAMQP